MNLFSLYAMPIAKFNASSFVEYGKSLFDVGIPINASTTSDGYKTSLTKIYTGSTPADLPPLPNSEELEKFIVKCGEEFASAIGFNTELYDISVRNIWINEMTQGGFNELHNHYGSNFSGCFYVDIPENSGFISFQTLLGRIDTAPLQVKNFTVFNSVEANVKVFAGDLYIWESHVKHQVKPAVYEGKRRSVAFDIGLEFKESKQWSK